MTGVNKFVLNTKRSGNWLIASGIIGLLLTLIFYGQREEFNPDIRENSFINTGFYWYPYAGYITLYYAINSCVVLLAGYLLKKANRIGVYLLLLAVLSVIASFFIVSNTGQTLFGFTVLSALGNFYLVIPPVGTLIFLITLLINTVLIGNWFEFTAKRPKPPQI